MSEQPSPARCPIMALLARAIPKHTGRPATDDLRELFAALAPVHDVGAMDAMFLDGGES